LYKLITNVYIQLQLFNFIITTVFFFHTHTYCFQTLIYQLWSYEWPLYPFCVFFGMRVSKKWDYLEYPFNICTFMSKNNIFLIGFDWDETLLIDNKCIYILKQYFCSWFYHENSNILSNFYHILKNVKYGKFWVHMIHHDVKCYICR